MLAKSITILLTVAAAVQAAPAARVQRRQAVTELISSGTVPAGCRTQSTSIFGIGIHKATDVPKMMGRRQATQAVDGQPSVPTVTNIVSVISDGQPQAPTATVTNVVSVISDGQPQAPTSTMMMMPVSQISDGQAQAFYTPVSQIGDGQVQAPTTGVSQIGDGQIQAPTVTGPAASQKTDGQPNVPTTGVTQGTDGQPAATPAPPAGNVHMVACKTDSTLELTIENGVLYDGQRRQGYIASNYQFQFDAGAPQAGAIITAGFSLCENNTLTLGGSSIFWQCLSGDFYNLYDRDWAAQCEPVYLTALDLIDCPA